MKSVDELILALRSKGIKLRVEAGNLAIDAPKGVLNAQTVDELRKHKAEIIALLHGSRKVQADSILRRVIDEPQLLSFSQQRLWFIDRLEGESSAYHIPVAVKLFGDLDRAALRLTLDTLIERHESLRTTFGEVEGSAVQIINATDGFALQEIDLSEQIGDEQVAAIRREASEEARSRFDLSVGPLIRGRLLKLRDDQYVLLVTMHHIVSDGWSIGVLIREVAELYTAYREGRHNPLPALPIQYADYAVWQRQWLHGEVLQDQIAYWEKHLSGAPAMLDLPTDRVRPLTQSYRGSSVSMLLDAELSAKLRALARQHDATLFMVLYTGFAILLSRLSGQEDVVIGTPVANRQRAEVEGLIGFFVNTLALRARLGDEVSVSGLLRQVKETALSAYSHQETPFEHVVEALQPARSLSHSPIFQAMLTLQNTPKSELRLPGLTLIQEETDNDAAQFDLSLFLQEAGDVIVGSFRYASDLFDQSTIERWSNYFQNVLACMVKDAEQKVSLLSFLSEDERHQVVKGFNDTATAYPKDKLIHELFEEQVEKTPDAVAVVYEDEQVTYGELNKKANQLAQHLRSQGVKPDTLVAIYTERSVEMVIGLLGVLKAGGAYVPLDPSYPQERLEYMLRDAAPRVVLTQERIKGALPSTTAAVIALDSEWNKIGVHEQTNLSAATFGLTPQHLAYVIYTSGSTGQPKGVAMGHGALVNLIEWQRTELPAASVQRTLQFAALSFDVAFQEIFSTLCAGGILVLLQEEVRRDPKRLIQFLRTRSVHRLFLPLSALRNLADAAVAYGEVLPCLENVITAGEQLHITGAMADFFLQLGTCRLHNHYGPTESHVVTRFSLEPNPSRWAAMPPIGRPIANAQIYILDNHRQPVPIGVSGEIYISGAGVARGYINQPDLTAERFIKDPFSADKLARMYRTGDLARWKLDGNIEYLGRNDHQVKIRGFRVELGEIESHLSRHPGIREAAVIAREDSPGEKRLVAYVTAVDERALSVEALRSRLKAALPEYMIPAAFVIIEALPLTPNGKVDRKALPAPDRSSLGVSEYEAPQGEIEESLASIWQELLHVERVGRYDDFFELGGHSLLVVQLVARISAVLSRELELRELFSYTTLHALANQLSLMTPVASSLLERADRGQQLPLSLAQQRLWFIDLLEGGGSAYHDGRAVRLIGELDRGALRLTLDTLIERHESLRTRFGEAEGNAVQIIDAAGGFALQEIDLSGQVGEEQVAAIRREASEEARTRFDLSVGPLIRGRLLRLRDEEHILLITMHHIVSDGWSIGILIREMAELYAAYREGRHNSLPALPIQYADYAVWQRQWLQGEVLHDQISYWKEQLSAIPALLELPTDRVRPLTQSYRGGGVSMRLDAELSAGLRALARQHDATLFMVLYAGFAILLSRLSGQEDIVIGTPVANRQRAEVEGLIGFFINTVALRARLGDEVSVSGLLRQVKEMALSAYSHQETPFAQVVEALQPARSLSHSPIFQVMLTLENTPQSELRLPGLTLIPQEMVNDAAQFDLSLFLQEAGDVIVGSFRYASDLFDQSTIERWSNYFQNVLACMVKDAEQKVSLLSFLSEDERHQVVKGFNDTATAYPKDKLIHELFEEQVEKTPDAVAVVYEEEQLTYEELNKKANQLAHYLRKQGVKPDTLVAIYTERNVEMVIGLLGILKAGGAYVPLDPSYPQERLEYMLRDAAPRVVLTQERIKGAIQSTTAAVIALDSEWNKIGVHEQTNLSAATFGLTPQHLAYVIYTSGSTGQPKGVMNEHRGIVNRLQWMQELFGLNRSDRVLQKTPFSFDVSVWEFFWTLLNGARLVIARPQGHKDPVYLNELITSAGITILHFVPSMLQSFLDLDKAAQDSVLRYVIVSGEELPLALQTRCLQYLPQAQLYNLYGPTEAAIDVTYWKCSAEMRIDRVPIGRPINNTQIYILDSHGSSVPIGVAGEIYIGGTGVARGYLNRPELTVERFIKDPFSADKHARMYKTGDMGRWKLDGNIEYLGRNDHQVKIRGFRIELGEIESQLIRYASVKDAVVVTREDNPGERRLVAYYTVQGAEAPSVEALRDQISMTLPEYMVPAAYVQLETLPLTPNGKLDRNALPAPDRNSLLVREYEAPQGEMEETLSLIWQDLLHVDRVGRLDNFFQLGGHSLMIVRMMERLRQINRSVEVRDVFTATTLSALASAIKSDAVDAFIVPPNLIPDGCKEITPEMLTLVDLAQAEIDRIVQTVPGGVANVQDIYPLTQLQEGILFHHLLSDEGDTYILPTLLILESRDRLDALLSAIQSVVNRHDILRSAVLWKDLSKPIQVVYREAVLSVEELELDAGRSKLEQLKERMSPKRLRMDLQRAPLLRAEIARDPDTLQWYLLLKAHHLIEDVTSLRLVIDEVGAHLTGQVERLPEPAPYREFVAQVMARAKKYDATEFFRTKLGDVDEPTAPYGLLDVYGDGSEISEAQQAIDMSLAEQVRSHARRLEVSVAAMFHAAYALVVAHTSGRNDVVFGSVLLGRLQGAAGTERVLGALINTLPLRLSLQGISVRQLIENTQREVVELLKFEQASLAEAQRCSGIVGGAPLFSAVLNFRNNTLNPATAELREESGLGISSLAVQERTNYPFTVSVDDFREGFGITVQTDRRIDPQRVIAYMQAAVKSLVDALACGAQTPVLQLSILPERERQQLVHEFNATVTQYPHDKSIHGLFAEQVERTPDAIAVVYEKEQLTYRQLNGKANQLAHYLRKQGVVADQLVAICVDRGIEMIVGLLGILKAGGAYVPLDPSYPAERLAYMLQDAAPQVLLTQARLKEGLPATTARLIALDSDWVEVEKESDWSVDSTVLSFTSRQLAYVIYTSGSTGQPKGVMVEHASVINFLSSMQERPGLSSTDCVLAVTTLAFDIAGLELYLPLLSGAKLVVANRETASDARLLATTLEHFGVTVMQATPASWRMLVSSGWSGRLTLKALCGGEALSAELADQIKPLVGELWNLYGPTETTIWSCTRQVMAHEAGSPPVESIGRPIWNTKIYIVDAQGQPVPIGVAGEIYIGGAGVARGYLNKAELTGERFIADSFSGEPEARMYKTGDVGRFKADGNIEYLGRNDDQVKIRGYRIELGEIESQLTRHAQIKEAVVIAREDVPGEKRLVGYVVPRAIEIENINGQLGFSLFYFGADTYAPEKKYELYLKSAKFADENGFEAIWTPERHFDAVGSLYPNPSILSAALAATTSRIQLRAGSVVLPLHDPIRIAEEWAVVDNLSNGRVGISIASGWHSRDFALAPHNYGSRKDVVREGISALRTLWSGHSIVRKDGNGKDTDIRIFPQPIQQELPLWLTAAGNPDTFIEAGRLGVSLLTHLLGQTIEELSEKIALYRKSLRENGHDPKRGRVTVMVHTFLGDDYQLTLDRARKPFMAYMRAHLGLLKPLIQSLGMSTDGVTTSDLEDVAEFAFERYARTASLIGAPKEALTVVNRLKEIGVDEIACLIDWMDTTAALEGLSSLQRLQDLSRTSPPTGRELKAYCSTMLPEYMVPPAFVVLDALPKTMNGKLDRKALPAPDVGGYALKQYEAPQGEIEEALANIWQQLLRIDRIGRQDNFFELGGHSLLAVQLALRIQHQLDVNVSVRDVFSIPQLSMLAEQIVDLQLREFDSEELRGLVEMMHKSTETTDK